MSTVPQKSILFQVQNYKKNKKIRKNKAYKQNFTALYVIKIVAKITSKFPPKMTTFRRRLLGI